jgi:hypothetical protein
MDGREACLAWDSVVYYVALPSEEYWDFRHRDDQKPEVVEAKSITRDQLVWLIILILFMLILLASLIAIIVWIIKTL